MLAGKKTPHDYRSVQAAPAAPLDPLLAPVAVEGYRVIASIGDAGTCKIAEQHRWQAVGD